MLALTFFISCIGIFYCANNYYSMKNHHDEGSLEMISIAQGIREGAMAFLKREYTVLGITALCVAVILGIFIMPSSGFAFLLGAILSASTGYIGMKASTLCNVRVTNMASKTLSLSKSLRVALKGGSVMGLCVGSFTPMGICAVLFFLDTQLATSGLVQNWVGIDITSYSSAFSSTMSSFILGCSTVALFARIGGGIFTKAADVGADQVGKVEQEMEEDDPRNPATIADFVGDNVGDTAGLGADLLESLAASVCSSIILAEKIMSRYAEIGLSFPSDVYEKLIYYPGMFIPFGLFACIIGLMYILSKKEDDSPDSDPGETLDMVTRVCAVLTAVFG